MNVIKITIMVRNKFILSFILTVAVIFINKIININHVFKNHFKLEKYNLKVTPYVKTCEIYQKIDVDNQKVNN